MARICKGLSCVSPVSSCFSPASSCLISFGHDDSESPFTPCKGVRGERGTEPAFQHSSLTPTLLTSCVPLCPPPHSEAKSREQTEGRRDRSCWLAAGPSVLWVLLRWHLDSTVGCGEEGSWLERNQCAGLREPMVRSLGFLSYKQWGDMEGF